MAIKLEDIHFLVTYRCTYACEHCFVWGSPDAGQTMTMAQLTSVIDQAAACGVTDVYFEGGEPTLAYPIVLAAAKRARERGLGFGMVSNCFWATSREDARLWLEPFVELGISAGNVFAGGEGPAAPAELAAPRPGGLAAVLEACDPRTRPLMRDILTGGPWALARAVGHAFARELYADECHLCYEVRAALRAAGRFPEVLTPGQCYAENEEEGDYAV